jgi:hypothetical protein
MQEQILSDTIKIGFPVIGTIFGAIVGALSTYFVTRLNLKNQDTKQKKEWRLNLIMHIASDVIEFEHVAGLYIASLSNKVRGVINTSIDYKQCEAALLTQSIPLRKARANLKILGLIQEDKLLEEYATLVKEPLNKGLNLSPERILELVSLITPGPVAFYKALSTQVK